MPQCLNGEWTKFYNSDSPEGEGDYETLMSVHHLIDDNVCNNPTSVDARRVCDGVHWSLLGQGQIEGNGFVCKNVQSYLPISSPLNVVCDDYEVRFCCPKCE